MESEYKETKLKNHNLTRNLSYSLLLIMPVMSLILPLIFNHTFVQAYVAITISMIMNIIVFYIIIKNSNSLNTLGIIIIWLARAQIVLNILFCLMLIHPIFNGTGTPSGGLVKNTTYVAYDDTCPYCAKSKPNMNRAVFVYNQTHRNKVKMIDLKSDKPISKEVTKYIKYKGSIVHMNKYGTVKTKIYTKGDKTGPIAASNSEIYELLREISR